MRARIVFATLLGIAGTLGMAFAATERPLIDPTISLGVLIHLATLIVTILGAFFVAGRFIERQKREFLERIQSLHLDMTEKLGSLTERVTVVESRMEDLWSWWKQMRGGP